MDGPVDLEWLRQRALNVIGHELRTPVSTVRGLAEVLAAGEDIEDQPALLAALVRNARRLELLLDDLLAASGVTTSLPVEPAGRVRVSDVVAVAVDGDERLDASGVGVVLARPKSVERIVAAVLTNARSYGDSPAVVAITDEAEHVLTVVDSPGPELAKADILYATEPFWRGERAVTTCPGLGLGLAVASRLASHEGGRLWVEGRPGGGLVTFFALPAA